ncbi:hypothetical protein [Lysinibacillus sp. NPDC096212]|uniref:hypothetical protein n=1 Tax=Lysinibacillus sp. NPDC096212 TaxID=3364135 RepID=UPI003806C018
MRIAQILYNKAHWIFEADEKPEFAPDIVLVDITSKNNIQEGWDYNSKTGKFTAPSISEPTPIEPQIDEIQAKILVNTETLISMKEMEV